MKVHYLHITCRKCIGRNYDVTFCQIFWKRQLSSSYDRLSPHHIWFDLDQEKQSSGGGGIYPPPKVENVLIAQGSSVLKRGSGPLCR